MLFFAVAALAGAAGVAVMRLVLTRALSRFRARRPGAGYALALAERAGLGLRLVLDGGLASGQAGYLPEGREIVLSRAVWEGEGIWAAAVAAHEVGHAVDHARGGLPVFLLAANGASGRLLLWAWGSAVLVLALPLAPVASAVLAVALLAGLPLACLELLSEWRASRWALNALADEIPPGCRRTLLLRLAAAMGSHAMPGALWLVAALAAAAAGPVSAPAAVVGACAALCVWAAVVLNYSDLDRDRKGENDHGVPELQEHRT